LKNGHFWDFFIFWAKITQKLGRPNFQALEKGATFHFLRLKKFFLKNFGILEHFCILRVYKTNFRMLAPTDSKIWLKRTLESILLNHSSK